MMRFVAKYVCTKHTEKTVDAVSDDDAMLQAYGIITELGGLDENSVSLLSVDQATDDYIRKSNEYFANTLYVAQFIYCDYAEATINAESEKDAVLRAYAMRGSVSQCCSDAVSLIGVYQVADDYVSAYDAMLADCLRRPR